MNVLYFIWFISAIIACITIQELELASYISFFMFVAISLFVSYKLDKKSN